MTVPIIHAQGQLPQLLGRLSLELLHQGLGYSSPESAHKSSQHLVKLDSWIVTLLKS